MQPSAFLPITAGMAPTALMESQEEWEEEVARREREEEESRRQNFLDNPEPILYSAGGGPTNIDEGILMDANLLSQQMSPSRGGFYEGGGTQQRFTPAREVYDINPEFMAGFQPETMYFQPGTINQPASATTTGGAPTIEDEYFGTKGGYGGPGLEIAPQQIIDPYAAYSGLAPPGLIETPETSLTRQITGAEAQTGTLGATPITQPQTYSPMDNIYGGEGPIGLNRPLGPGGSGFLSGDPQPRRGDYDAETGGIEYMKAMRGWRNAQGIPQPGSDRTTQEQARIMMGSLGMVPPDTPDQGYQDGGITESPVAEVPLQAAPQAAPQAATDIMQDPITQEVVMFLVGETDNQQVVNDFIAKYGNEIFLQLRNSVLQSLVPGAETQGQIMAEGESGMSDDIPGVIGADEKIAVSQDEFIVPADVVSGLGDGSSDAGSDRLHEMMDRVRQAKTGGTTQPPRINPNKMLPA
jgi:hypothetical protein